MRINLRNIIKLLILITSLGCLSCGTADYYGYDLHQAVMSDNTDLVIKLIDSGSPLEATDSDGATPIMWAIKQGKKNNVEILIKHGAKINYWTEEGETPLGAAAQLKHTEIVKLLLVNGADVNIGRWSWTSRPLSSAASSCDLESAKLMIEKGADVNYEGTQYPPILLAARENCFSVFDLLLSHGAKINISDKDGNTLQEMIENKPILKERLSVVENSR